MITEILLAVLTIISLIRDEWEYSYIVSGLTDTSMIWTAKEDMGEMKVYTRCNEVPADIIAGTRASF